MSKKNIFISTGLFFLFLFLGIAGIEIFVRNSDIIPFTALYSRHQAPYIQFGDFRAIEENPNVEPSRFSYEERNGTYVFNPRDRVPDIQDRIASLLGPRSLEELYQAKQNQKDVVFLMGGSAALGDGAKSDENRLPRLLDSSLKRQAKFLNTEVFPAAVRAFVSTQERVALDLYVLPLKPKAIIFFHGFNDANQDESMARPGDPYNQGIEYSRYGSGWFRFNQTIAEFSYIWRYLFINRTENEITQFRLQLSKEQKKTFNMGMAQTYLKNVRWMSSRCEQEAVECFFVLQPANISDDHGKHVEPVVYSFIRESLKTNPLRSHFIDLGSLFSDRADFFVDVVHMNDEAQKKLVEIIQQEISPFL